jgi:hypothetical protein
MNTRTVNMMESFTTFACHGLNDYWSESEVQWDKIKNETQSLVVVQGDKTN